jgi:hypothetical protein
MVFHSPLLNADQAMALKREEYGMLCRGLAEFSVETVRVAAAIVQSDTLYRSEHVSGVVSWLLKLHGARLNTGSGWHKENVVWRAVATAPVGWCHIRTTMIGTLLEDIASGMSQDRVASRFATKMNPTQYQRPQAAPSTGNIAQAEKIVASLGIAASLNRRMARIEEIEKLWVPSRVKKEPTTGVFSHLRTKSEMTPLNGPTLTFEKFMRTVIPEAAAISVHVGSRMNYAAMLTATDPDSPPILQWDRPECRNPVSWYVYMGGSASTQWGLIPNIWVRVNAIALLPHMWHEPIPPQHGKGVVLVLEGCRDSKESGSGLFPEILKSELHGIRSTIEAHSRTAIVGGRTEATACGIDLRENNKTWDITLRVTSRDGSVIIYKLDRWD